MALSIVILAAGQGTRMCSGRPKVLHMLAGKTLLEHVYQTAAAIPHDEIYIVYGHGGQQVPERLQHLKANWIEQKERLGTAHAVKQALSHIHDANDVLILYGDVPLITKPIIQTLVSAVKESGFALMTACLDDPHGYGRIVRDSDDNIVCVIEDKDADEEQRRICEINTGLMVVRAEMLERWIASVRNDNSRREYYLTDIIALAIQDGISVNSIMGASFAIQGINDHIQLAEAERYLQRLQAHNFMRHGLGLMDPARFDLRGDLEVGHDVIVDINVIIEGRVKLGNNISIGANCYIRNSVIADNVQILPNTIIDNAAIGSQCRIGPFARIRPDTTLNDEVHIGNFVELKKVNIGAGSNINHLSYIGDAEIGGGTNIGAGVVTCNYDGANKHKTVIGDNVFVGSDAQLIAPVTIMSGATIAAGATIAKDVTADALAIARVEQRELKNWKRPAKK